MLRDSIAVVAVVRTRPRAMRLAMISMKKINSWVSFSFLYEYGAPLGGPSGRRSSAIIRLYLTKTGNYQIHEFDWLKSILKGV